MTRMDSMLLKSMAMVALLVGCPARAQVADPGDVAVERMRLASTRDGIIGVEAGTVPEHLSWEAGAWLGFAKDPLVIVRLSDSERVGTLVGNRLGGALSGTLGLWGRGAVALELPFVLFQDRDPGQIAVGSLAPIAAAGLGAARLVPRFALLTAERHGLDLSAMVGVRIPTGHDGSFISSPGVEVEPEVAVSRVLGPWRLAANVGAVLRSSHHVLNLELGSELTAQAGVARKLSLGAHLPSELLVTLSGTAAGGRPFSTEEESALEARGAAAWDLTLPVRLIAGAGLGLSEGWGVPAWRVFLAAQYAPAKPKAAPAPPPAPAHPPREAPTPPPPEPQPPAQAPPPDADGDGVLDPQDRCPSESGPSENGGCPDGDRDADAVIDRLDECPDVPGPAENRGCPKSGAVKLTGEKIEFEGSVYFDTDKDVIQSRSYELLDSVAKVIQAHGEIGRVRVEGHTDSLGGRAHNLDLSKRRAKAVVRYLAERGVDETRLTGEGYGPDRPVADNETPDGRAKNRRVEFHVEPMPASGEKP